jgi:hypothetical protein
MFIAAVFTIAKLWKPRYQTADEWIKENINVHGILFIHK